MFRCVVINAAEVGQCKAGICGGSNSITDAVKANQCKDGINEVIDAVTEEAMRISHNYVSTNVVNDSDTGGGGGRGGGGTSSNLRYPG